jgi:hypothetical protein
MHYLAGYTVIQPTIFWGQIASNNLIGTLPLRPFVPKLNGPNNKGLLKLVWTVGLR